MAFGIGAAILIGIIAVIAHRFMAPRPKAVAKPQLTVVGVGLYVLRDPDTGQFIVTRTFANSPAQKAGITKGLILNKIDGVLAETKPSKALSKMLVGPVGSKVTLELIDTNDGTTHQVELTRAQFVNHSGKEPAAPRQE